MELRTLLVGTYCMYQPKGLQCNFNSDIVQLHCPTIEDAKIFTYSWGEAKNPGRVSEFPTKF